MTAGASDFDFLHGSWRVAHRRLGQRLKGSTEQAFSADAGATWEPNWIMEFERV